jgi:histidyl-tRNA synthetase
VLDDKRPEVKAQVADAPLIIDHLCAACKAHHDRVRELLSDLSIPWEDAPRLVRGLDYYTRTTYEFDHPLLGAQSGIGGGGRYDGLSEAIGGPALPGIGFGLGLDRTMLALEKEGITLPTPSRCQAYGVPLGDEAARAMFTLIGELRAAGIAADMAYGGKGLKGAMKGADRSGARFALILGDRDLQGQVVQLKDLTTAEQTEVPLAQVVDLLKGKIS